jgi:hypothetical protein
MLLVHRLLAPATTQCGSASPRARPLPVLKWPAAVRRRTPSRCYGRCRYKRTCGLCAVGCAVGGGNGGLTPFWARQSPVVLVWPCLAASRTTAASERRWRLATGHSAAYFEPGGCLPSSGQVPWVTDRNTVIAQSPQGSRPRCGSCRTSLPLRDREHAIRDRWHALHIRQQRVVVGLRIAAKLCE